MGAIGSWQGIIRNEGGCLMRMLYCLWLLVPLALLSCTPPKPPEVSPPQEASALEQLYEEAKAAYRAGRYAEAAAKFARVVQADPQHVRALINWGVALSRGGKPQQAIPKFQQALVLDPAQAEAYYNWGVALERLGRHAEAVAKYERAIELNAKLLTPTLKRYLERHRPLTQDTAIESTPTTPTPRQP